jgi:hypothetical protein
MRDPAAASRSERFVEAVQVFARLLPDYDLADPEDAASVRKVLSAYALEAHVIELEAERVNA